MTKFSFDTKLKAVQMYLSGMGSETVTRRLGIRNRNNVLMWTACYRKYGVQGLEIRSPKYDYNGDKEIMEINSSQEMEKIWFRYG